MIILYRHVSHKFRQNKYLLSFSFFHLFKKKQLKQNKKEKK